MGFGVTTGWIATNLQLMGYNGVVSYLPAKNIAAVVFVTQGPKANQSVAYASAIYNHIATLLAPEQPPSLPACPRPPASAGLGQRSISPRGCERARACAARSRWWTRTRSPRTNQVIAMDASCGGGDLVPGLSVGRDGRVSAVRPRQTCSEWMP